MSINLKCPSWTKSLLIFMMGLGTMCLAFGSSGVEAQGNTVATGTVDEIVAITGDISEILLCKAGFSRADLLGVDNCISGDQIEEQPKKAVSRIKVVLTAYSSTVAQTDSTPFVTANGTYVHDGVVANNGLPFGTEIRIPDLYGNKVFSVEDRMHWRKGNYHFDIWFPTYEQAKNFGVKYAYVEVLRD
jgi:3D (Asp-Asp-Asp) domain-containing protein